MSKQDDLRASMDVDQMAYNKQPMSDAVFDALAAAEAPTLVPALALDEAGNIPAGRFTLTPRGLLVSEGATFEDWQGVGKVLRRLDTSLQWLIGDWLAYGGRVWGQTYEQAAELTGFTVGTLYQYVYVAMNVEFSIRVETLSFKHHQLVAGLSADEQRHWLEYAVDQGLSVAALGRAIEGLPPALPSGIVGRVQALFAHQRRDLMKLRSKMSKAGQGEKSQLSQLIAEQRALLDEIERALEE